MVRQRIAEAARWQREKWRWEWTGGPLREEGECGAEVVGAAGCVVGSSLVLGFVLEVDRGCSAAFGDEMALVCAEVICSAVEGSLALMRTGNGDGVGLGAGAEAEAGADAGAGPSLTNAGTEWPHAHAHARMYSSPNERKARQHIVLFEFVEEEREKVHAQHACGR